MADNHNTDGNASKSQGSSDAAPNSAAPRLSLAKDLASSASAPRRSGQQGDRRGFRDQRGGGRGGDRGKSRGRGNGRGGRQKQELGRGEWRYVTHLLLIDNIAN